jgi:hypothetical protein
MIDRARAWLAVAAAVAGVIGLSQANAGADPLLPNPPTPPTVTATATPAAGALSAVTPGQPQFVPNPALAAPFTAPAPPVNALAPPLGASAPPPTATAPPPAAAPALQPATSGSLTDYFKAKNVAMQPQTAPGFQALAITLPMPSGWSPVPDPNVPDAFMVIANRDAGDGFYTPNAALVVYKLVGDFDPKEAITHGFIDSQTLPAWQTTDSNLGDFCGFPSSLIEGTYRSGSVTLNTSRRNVIASSGPDRYLVSLAVSTSASQAVALAPATDPVVNGFRVGAPAPPPPLVPGLPGFPPPH